MTIPILIFADVRESGEQLHRVLRDTVPHYLSADLMLSRAADRQELKAQLPGHQNGLLFYLTPKLTDELRSHIKSIQLTYPRVNIVLVAGRDEAYSAWEIEVDHFVSSPTPLEDLLRPLRRYIIDHSPKTTPILKLNYQGGLYQLKVGDILYCRADGNYSHIYVASGNKLTVTIQINKIQSRLQAFPVIQRVGRSFLFNMSRIKEIDATTVRFNNVAANELHLSKGYTSKLKNYLLG